MNRRTQRSSHELDGLESAVAVVVPAFNEAAHIESVLRTVPSFVDTIICVDDGSTDATSTIASTVDGVVLVRHRRNLGVGAALVSGYRKALELDMDIVAVMAGDGQMEPDELEALVQPVARGELDYVKGDRLGHPDVASRMPRLRRFGTQALAILTRWVAGPTAVPELRDAQCGFTAVSADMLRRIPLERLYPRYGYPNDMVVMLAHVGARIGHRVVSPVYANETSGLRPMRAIFTHSYVLGRAALWRLRQGSR